MLLDPVMCAKNLSEQQASTLRSLPPSPLGSHAKASEIWSACLSSKNLCPAWYIDVEKLLSQKRLGPLTPLYDESRPMF